MSDKDKYYIDGYGTKRPKDVPFWDSAKGQLVKKAGNDLLTTGSFALGLLLPFGKLKILKTLSRVLNGAAIADFVTSDRVTTVDDDIKNGEYGKAAGAIGSGFRCNRNLHIFKKWKRQPLIRLPFVVLRLYKIFIFNSFKEPTSSDSKYIRY